MYFGIASATAVKKTILQARSKIQKRITYKL